MGSLLNALLGPGMLGGYVRAYLASFIGALAMKHGVDTHALDIAAIIQAAETALLGAVPIGVASHVAKASAPPK